MKIKTTRRRLRKIIREELLREMRPRRQDASPRPHDEDDPSTWDEDDPAHEVEGDEEGRNPPEWELDETEGWRKTVKKRKPSRKPDVVPDDEPMYDDPEMQALWDEEKHRRRAIARKKDEGDWY